MSVIVRKADTWKSRGWTAIPNTIIRDQELGLDAVGLVAWIASHSDNFQLTVRSIAAGTGTGINRVGRLLRRIEEVGFLTRVQDRDGEGRVAGVAYELHPEPVAEDARTVTPPRAAKRPASAWLANKTAGQDRCTDGGATGIRCTGISDTDGGVTYRKDEKTKEEEEKTTSSPRALRARDETTHETRPEVEALCQHLAERISGNGAKRPTIGKQWRDAARLLIDRDGHSLAEIKTIIDWCQDDDFWRSNILSMPALRRQFDRLVMRRGSDRQRTARPVSPRRGAYVDWSAPEHVAQAESDRQQHGPDLFELNTYPDRAAAAAAVGAQVPAASGGVELAEDGWPTSMIRDW